MPRRVHPDAVSQARHLLVDYYSCGKRRHTFDSIARRTGVSRSTVARLAREIRDALPTVTSLEQRITSLEREVERLTSRLVRKAS